MMKFVFGLLAIALVSYSSVHAECNHCKTCKPLVEHFRKPYEDGKAIVEERCSPEKVLPLLWKIHTEAWYCWFEKFTGSESPNHKVAEECAKACFEELDKDSVEEIKEIIKECSNPDFHEELWKFIRGDIYDKANDVKGDIENCVKTLKEETYNEFGENIRDICIRMWEELVEIFRKYKPECEEVFEQLLCY